VVISNFFEKLFQTHFFQDFLKLFLIIQENLIKKSISLKPRMAEEERLNTLAQNTLITYNYLLLNE